MGYKYDKDGNLTFSLTDDFNTNFNTPTIDTNIEQASTEVTNKRSPLDRFFDVLQTGQYTVMGALSGVTDNDLKTGFWNGAWEGLKAGNPLGEGNEKGEKYFSDVLGNMGWKPKSLFGKAVRGTIGFVGDVAFDPLTYLTGGASALVKGTGTKLAKKAGVETVEKFNGNMARKVIEELAFNKTGKPYKATGEEIADLVRRMNDIKGIAKQGEGLEFGLKYMPFSKKLGLNDVSTKLIEDNKLRKLGDDTIAPYFNTMLDWIKSNKTLGKLNPGHKVYLAMKENPGEVAKFLKFYDYTRGLHLEKLDANKMVKEFAEKNLNLSPDTQKLITEILEDKTLFGKRVSQIPLSKTQVGIDFASNIQKEIDDLKNYITSEENIVKTVDDVVEPITKINESLSTIPDVEKQINKIVPKIEEGKIVRDYTIHPKTGKQINLPYNITVTQDGKMVNKSTGELYGTLDGFINDAPVKMVDANIEVTPVVKDIIARVEQDIQVKEGRITEKNLIKGIMRLNNQDKKIFVNHLINNNPVLRNEFSVNGFKIGEELSNDVMNNFIHNYFKGTYQDILNTKHRMSENIKSVYSAMKQKYSSYDQLKKEAEGLQKTYVNLEKQIKTNKTRIKSIDASLEKLHNHTRDYSKTITRLEQERTNLIKGLNENYNTLIEMQNKLDKLQNMRVKRMQDIDYLVHNPQEVDKFYTSYIDDSKNILDDVLEQQNKYTENINLAEEARQTRSKPEYAGNTDEVLKEENKIKTLDDLREALAQKELKRIAENKGITTYEEKLVNKGLGESEEEIRNRIAEETFGKSYDKLAKATDMASKLQAGMVRREANKHLEKITQPIKEKSTYDILPKESQKKIDDLVAKRDGTLTPSVKFDVNAPKTEKIVIKNEIDFADNLAKKTFGRSLDDIATGITPVDKQQYTWLQNKIKQRGGNLDNYFGITKGTVEKSVDNFTKQNKHLIQNNETIEKVVTGKMTIDEAKTKLINLERTLREEEYFEVVARKQLGDKAVNTELAKHRVISDIFDENKDIDDVTKNIVRELQKQFKEMAHIEKSVGSLKGEQIIEAYVYHMINPKGIKNLDKKTQEFITDLFGFGTQKNPFAESRKYKDTIKNINQEMLDKYGFEIFNNQIMDIYLARALKHNELVYANKLTRDLLTSFGTSLYKTDDLVEGYRAVINIHDLRKYIIKQTKGDTDKGLELLQQMGFKGDELNKFGTPLVEIHDSVHLKNLLRKYPGLKTFSVSDIIVDKANRAGHLQSLKDTNALLSMYDRFLHLYKMNVTAVLPGFHIRNKISNAFQNWLALGEDVISSDLQSKGWKAVQSAMNGEKITGTLRTDLGKEIPLDELWRMAEKYGVIDSNMFAKDIPLTGQSGLLERFGVKPKFDPTNADEFIPYKLGRKVGNFVENQDRLIHFMASVKQGQNYQEASESVFKFLFDYGDLTDFEITTMKRIVPFYTWLRKNVPLQLEQMLTQTHKYTSIPKITGEIEAQIDEDKKTEDKYLVDFAKDWTQLPINVKNPKGEEEPVFWNPNLPYGDINRVPNPLTPIDGLKQFITQSTPALKVPIELANNRNFYFDSDIDKGYDEDAPGYIDPIGNITGEPMKMSPRVKYVLDQLASVKVAGEFIEKKGVDLGVHALNTLGGVKVASYDYNKYKKQMIEERLKKQGGVR